MKKTRLPMLATLVIALAACGGGGGGGGDSSDQNANQNQNPSQSQNPSQNQNPSQSQNPTLSDLDKAKALVRTAKKFISDADVVEKSYENAADFMSEQQSVQLSGAVNVASEIVNKAQEDDLASMTAADISKYFSDSMISTHKVKAASDFKVTKNAAGQSELNGSLTLTPITRVWVSSTLVGSTTPVVNQTEKEGTPFTVKYSGFALKLPPQKKTNSLDASYEFGKVEIGTGESSVTLSSGASGLAAQVGLSKAYDLTESSLQDFYDAGGKVNNASIRLDQVMINVGKNEFKAENFEILGKDFSIKTTDGKQNNQFLVTAVSLGGQLKLDNPETDVQVMLKVKADESTIADAVTGKKTADGIDDLEEVAGKFVKADVTLELKGNVTQDKKVTPLDFKASLKRSGKDEITLNSLTANVDGDTLTLTGKGGSKVENGATIGFADVKLAKGDASVSVALKDENDFTSSDILVSGKKQGTVFKQSNGSFVAKFVDNSTIAF